MPALLLACEGNLGARILTAYSVSMKRRIRTIIFALVSVMALAIAAPSLATESTAGGDTTGTTVAPADVSSSQSPAVPAPPPDVKEFDQPWTVRFIYPLIVLITGLLIVGLAIGYNRRVRRRYRVVG